MNQKKSKDRFFIDMSGFCHRAFSLKFSRLSTSITLEAIGKEESGQRPIFKARVFVGMPSFFHIGKFVTGQRLWIADSKNDSVDMV